MRKLLLIPVLLALLFPFDGAAAHYSSSYVIPVASHATGANGTLFRSDIAIQNFQSTPLTVQMLFIESGFTAPDNVFPLLSSVLPAGEITVPALGNVRLVDVLDGYMGKSDGIVGAIVLAGDAPFAVTSRSYTSKDSGTVGSTVLPVRDFLESATGDTVTPASAYIPGLVSNDFFRSNIGFVAAADTSAMQIDIVIRNMNGAVIGQRSFLVLPGSAQHMQVSVRSIASASFDAGSAEVRIASGDGAIAPYASVVDNRSADAAYISGVLPPNERFSKGAGRNFFDIVLQSRSER